MKYFNTILLVLTASIGYGQLSIETIRNANSAEKIYIGSYSYHEEFIGHKNYGAPAIQTNDGGGALFGDGEDKDGNSVGTLVKLDKAGKIQWKKEIKPQFDGLESQSVLEDKKGNFYVFMLSYDYKKYRGGTQRVIAFDKTGKQLWDKTFGKYDVMNSPTISYIKLLPEGKILLRGHIVTDQPAEGKDPIYRYWEGWLTTTGQLTEKSGDTIDWGKDNWQARLKPE